MEVKFHENIDKQIIADLIHLMNLTKVENKEVSYGYDLFVGLYRELLGEIESSLQGMSLDFSMLPLLPGDLYADTSHPVGEGYSLLAEHIWIELRNLP